MYYTNAASRLLVNLKLFLVGGIFIFLVAWTSMAPMLLIGLISLGPALLLGFIVGPLLIILPSLMILICLVIVWQLCDRVLVKYLYIHDWQVSFVFTAVAFAINSFIRQDVEI